MEKRHRILLYGNTLMLAAMRASLEADPAFEVIALDASQTVGHELITLNPDIVIFDTASIQPQFHYDLMQPSAGLLLIGIDPDSNQALLWSGQHLGELSVQDLVKVIHQRQSSSDPFKKAEK